MKLSILTLDKMLYQDEALSVSAPGIEGQLQVLEHHVPLITALKRGTVKVQAGKETKEFPVENGVLEVRPDEVNILIS